MTAKIEVDLMYGCSFFQNMRFVIIAEGVEPFVVPIQRPGIFKPYPGGKTRLDKKDLCEMKESFNKFIDGCLKKIKEHEREFDELTPEEKNQIKEFYFNGYKRRGNDINNLQQK